MSVLLTLDNEQRGTLDSTTLGFLSRFMTMDSEISGKLG
jgi:hypothetical protein